MARFDLIATYMMANRRYGAIYTGSTSDLSQRLWQHRSGKGSLFTGKYECTKLVWFERHDLVTEAKHRERRIKTWPRQ